MGKIENVVFELFEGIDKIVTAIGKRKAPRSNDIDKMNVDFQNMLDGAGRIQDKRLAAKYERLTEVWQNWRGAVDWEPIAKELLAEAKTGSDNDQLWAQGLVSHMIWDQVAFAKRHMEEEGGDQEDVLGAIERFKEFDIVPDDPSSKAAFGKRVDYVKNILAGKGFAPEKMGIAKDVEAITPIPDFETWRLAKEKREAAPAGAVGAGGPDQGVATKEIGRGFLEPRTAEAADGKKEDEAAKVGFGFTTDIK